MVSEVIKNQKMEKIQKMILEVNSMTLVKKVSSMETILSLLVRILMFSSIKIWLLHIKIISE